MASFLARGRCSLRAAAVALLVGVAGCGLFRGQGGRTLAAFDFDTSAEQWVVFGDTGVIEPDFEPDGGAPGGHIACTDDPIGETWYFRVPAVVLSDLADAAGGTISYSLKQSSVDAGFLEDDIIIEGPAGRLSYRFGTAPGVEWTRFVVELSASAGWRWNWNAPATDEQIRSVLANATRFDIRGEYRTGPDVGALDSFRLTAAE